MIQFVTQESDFSDSLETRINDSLYLINPNNGKTDLVTQSKIEGNNKMFSANTNNIINLIEEAPLEENIQFRKNSSDQILLNIRKTGKDNWKQFKFGNKPDQLLVIQNSSGMVNNFYINQQFTSRNSLKSNTIFQNLKFENERIIFIDDSIGNKPDSNAYPSNKSVINLVEINNDIETLTFIIADDEPLARQSTIRNFKKAANKLNRKISILESQDGIETLNLVYKSILNKQKLSGIITDQTMRVLKGSNFAEIMVKLFEIKVKVPLFLVSAYKNKSMINNVNLFDEVFSKPLTIAFAEHIITFSDNYAN